ncbi:MAG: heme-binding protein [Thermogutta sp.]
MRYGRWTILSLSLGAIMLLVQQGFSIGAQFPDHPYAERYRHAAELLEAALPADSEEDTTASLERLSKGLAAAVDALPADSYVADRLRSLKERLQTAEASPVLTDATSALILAIVRDLRFVPRAEASLPEGFPAPTPVGEVEVKAYPTYRAAVTDNGSAAFWRLFAHIKKNGVEMTAPVEMRYAPNGETPVLMAFLYEGPNQGQTGADGAVTVRDEPASLVVSTGVRGSRTDANLEKAKARVGAWLDKHADRYESVGPPRVLGYNSPFVPRDLTYWEYQIPVREKGTPQPKEGTAASPSP